jgi:hypothetical protein
MIDLQEIVRTTFGQANPTPEFYVSVEDAKKLLAEVKRLQMDLKFATAKAAYFEHDADCCGGCIKCLQLSRELDAAEKAREA